MISKKTNAINIHTPEGVVFSLHLAGPVTRFLAWLLDFFSIMAISTIVNTFLKFFGFLSKDLNVAMVTFSYFVISIGYSIILEWFWNGQTLGKRLFKLRVMDVQGLHLKFSQIVIRNLLRFVDSLPSLYMVGGLSLFLTKNCQRVGDIAANTIVVTSPDVSKPDFAQLFSDKYNSFRDYPHLGARVRKQTTPVEANIGLQALLRRETLEPVARIKLFKEIADHFKSIIVYPQEATDGLSDEQYIRNIVDVLFRK